MNERRADLFKNFQAKSGRDASYLSLSAEQRAELDGLIIQATQIEPKLSEVESRQLVIDATGISPLTFSTGLIYLINDGVLEKNSLKFESTPRELGDNQEETLPTSSEA